jgi:TRAP-type C4-dicarboxylate transport system permease small subunit
VTGAPRGPLRRALDAFYAGCGVLAGLALIGIAACVLIQIVARLAGAVVTWTAEFAGYAMAASSFLALAATLNSGGHIRVDLLLVRLPTAARRIAEAACLVLANLVVGYFAWHSVEMAWQSYQFNDVGQGSFAVPLWVPQSLMALGVVALAVLFVDNLVTFVARGTTTYVRRGERALYE